MKQGRKTCDALRHIRQDIAAANNIDYQPTPCTFEGDCSGTCPRCEQELHDLECELDRLRLIGKAAVVAGVAMTMGVTSTPLYSEVTNTDVPGMEQPLPDDERTLMGEVAMRIPYYPGGPDAFRQFVDTSFDIHITQVDSAVRATWKAPLRTVVSIIITFDGTMGDISVADSSGNETFDRFVMSLFDDMPQWEGGDNDFRIDVPVSYVVGE